MDISFLHYCLHIDVQTSALIILASTWVRADYLHLLCLHLKSSEHENAVRAAKHNYDTYDSWVMLTWNSIGMHIDSFQSGRLHPNVY